jgi:hypothetical protein
LAPMVRLLHDYCGHKSRVAHKREMAPGRKFFQQKQNSSEMLKSPCFTNPEFTCKSA